MTQKVLLFLKEHPLISVNALEKQCKIPRSTIDKVRRGRKMPRKHMSGLVEVLKMYGFNEYYN